MILGDGTITATARPNFPWPTAHTDTRNNRRIWVSDRPVPLNYQIPMDWHHMIPWKDLRNGWSALATSGRWEVLKAWVTLWSLPNVDAIITQMRNGTLGGPVNAAMFDKLCWAQWNLVEGPFNGNRTDDPGSDKLDVFNGIHMPNNIRDRSNTLNLIYSQLKLWQSTTANITQSQAKNLVGYFTSLKGYKNSPISTFSPKVWVLVSAGKINSFGIASKHPTWRKNI